MRAAVRAAWYAHLVEVVVRRPAPHELAGRIELPAFVAFTSPLEGVVRWLYQDVRGLVTVAIGDLVDPMPLALSIPFVRADGSPASSREIADAWTLVKTRPDLARLGYRAAERVTSIRLTDAGVARVVNRKLADNERQLLARFPELDSWPADAQLATHSLAWACGASFRFPRLEAALHARDFGTAAVECQMDARGNPGLIPRNRANKLLYVNAACVVRQSLDPETLYYPRDLAAETPTEPELATVGNDRQPSATVGNDRQPSATVGNDRQPSDDDDEQPVTIDGGTVHPPLEFTPAKYDGES
jgi:hypothetical protein